jgi:mRNA-degrading endonuclease toxin of MazEF toxin-antitoxin module
VKRGEVWDAVLPLPAKPGPVLILSRDSMPASRPEFTVAYLTRKSRNPAVEVPLTAAADGVDVDCVVNLDSVNTVPKKWLTTRTCKLSPAKMRAVANAIRVALDLS